MLASVCYFPTDIHDAALSSTGDDSLARAAKGEIKGEVVLIFGVQDGHIVRFPLSLLQFAMRPKLISWVGLVCSPRKGGPSFVKRSLRVRFNRHLN